jgi:hypothetical protein
MKVTDEMIDAAVGTFGGQGTKVITRGTIRHALVMALANIPEPVLGPFVLAEYEQGHVGALRAVMAENVAGGSIKVVLNAIDRACKTLAAPVPAGGEWSADDYAAAERAIEQRDRKYSVHASARAALDAVKHRLAVPAIEPLSDELRILAQHVERYVSSDTARTVAAELLRRCPKPAPKQRTAEELAAELLNLCHKPGPSFQHVLDEIVALAKKGEK